MNLFSQPGFVMGILFSVTYASLYHLWKGHTLGLLLVAFLMAGIGFGLGQGLGLITQFQPLQMGQLYLLESSLGAWAALFILHIFRVPPMDTDELTEL